MIAAEDHSSLLNMNTRLKESDYFVPIWRLATFNSVRGCSWQR